VKTATQDPNSEGYEFKAADLDSCEEDVRRWAIIHISRNKLRQYEDKLINLLAAESGINNRRHLVRALGKIGSQRALSRIIEIIKDEEGLIVGDAAEALGRLRAAEAKTILEGLAASPIPWIANKSRWALKELARAET
jgi:HEAT repeat protein